MFGSVAQLDRATAFSVATLVSTEKLLVTGSSPVGITKLINMNSGYTYRSYDNPEIEYLIEHLKLNLESVKNLGLRIQKDDRLQKIFLKLNNQSIYTTNMNIEGLKQMISFLDGIKFNLSTQNNIEKPV